MREALKNLFSNTITLENGDQYNYSIQPFDLANSLGTVIASLQQYTFSAGGAMNKPAEYKLYKTKEGNWYDVEQSGVLMEKNIIRMLKSAIDKKAGDTISA